MKRWVVRSVQSALNKANLSIVRPGIPYLRDTIDLFKILTDKLTLPSEEVQVVQIGANDGGVSDPIYPLITRKKWNAVLVEPQGSAVHKLRLRYAELPQVSIEQCAIGPMDGEATLYAIDPDAGLPEIFGHLATFDRAMLVRQVKHIPRALSHILEITVPTKTMTTLLSDHGIERVHLLQVDAEGFDYEILKMTFAANIMPDIINFESWHLSFEQKRHIAQMLHEANYYHLNLVRDTIAARAELLAN